jgi:hypothetical protein
VAPAAIVVGYDDAAAASLGLRVAVGVTPGAADGLALADGDGAALGVALGAADGVPLRAAGHDDADAGGGDVTTWATPIPATSTSADPAATVRRDDSRPSHVLPPITTPSPLPD